MEQQPALPTLHHQISISLLFCCITHHPSPHYLALFACNFNPDLSYSFLHSKLWAFYVNNKYYHEVDIEVWENRIVWFLAIILELSITIKPRASLYHFHVYYHFSTNIDYVCEPCIAECEKCIHTCFVTSTEAPCLTRFKKQYLYVFWIFGCFT